MSEREPEWLGLAPDACVSPSVILRRMAEEYLADQELDGLPEPALTMARETVEQHLKEIALDLTPAAQAAENGMGC